MTEAENLKPPPNLRVCFSQTIPRWFWPFNQTFFEALMWPAGVGKNLLQSAALGRQIVCHFTSLSSGACHPDIQKG